MFNLRALACLVIVLIIITIGLAGTGKFHTLFSFSIQEDKGARQITAAKIPLPDEI